MIQIVVGGDVCPSNSDASSFIGGDASAIFHDLLDDIRSADLSIVNLECPLTDVDSPIAKCGPHLRASTSCIAGLKDAGIHVLNMANNHILDHGAQGLESTLRIAESAGIAAVGAGRNREEARRILIRKVGDMRIGILCVAEHEFSIAGVDSPGANPLDLIDIVRNITAHREEWGFLVVLLHGGNEGYPFPSPRLMDTCRFLVEQGAGAVICQHSHCVGCYEEYRGGHIVYGQGNLVFDGSVIDRSFKDGPWTEGVLVDLRVTADCASSMRLLPYTQSRAEIGARKLGGTAADDLLHAVEERSARLRDKEFVQAEWHRRCKEQSQWYLSRVLGYRRLGRLLRCFDIVKCLYSPFDLRVLENTIRCETHREALETVLEERNRCATSRE